MCQGDKSDHGRPPRPPHPVLPGAPPKPHPGGIPGHQHRHAHRSGGDSQQVKCESLSFNTCFLQNPHAGTLPRPTEKQRAVCPALAFLQRRQRHPLQYSCLENPRDGGAWWAAVHGVAKSRTRLSDFTFTFHFHASEKEMAPHSSVLAWRIPGTGEPGGLQSMGPHRVGHD